MVLYWAPSSSTSVMNSAAILAQAVGIAYSSGISLYATVGVVGLASRTGLVGPLPGSLSLLANPWVIGIALALYVVEFLSTLVPGVASAWETLHSFIRPPAAAALAGATAWHGDPAFILLAAFLGGGVAASTHTTKLGLRYAIDSSPEPLSNGVANVAELGVVTMIAIFLWEHPFISLALAFVLLVAMLVLVRMIWRALRQVLSGRWMPSCGLSQEPRASQRPAPATDDWTSTY